MSNIRTAVLHNGVDASAEYARKVAEQITDECAVVDAYTNAPLRHVLPVRAVPNVMVCLFCDGLEEYQEVAAIINQLNQIKSADFTTATFVEQTEKGNIDESTAAQHPELFTEWDGNSVSVYDGTDGEHPQTWVRGKESGLLYKCRMSHTTQEDWPPERTPNMWAVVDVTHAGTIDDPIPAERGMEYEYGKYYLDPDPKHGGVYLCEREGEAAGGTVVLHFLPHELTGNYFTLVE